MTRIHRPYRTGFTLLELLVVISIIGILMSLTGAAIFKTIQVRKRKVTEETIKKLYLQLQRHMKAVIDDARTEPIPTSVLTLAGGDQNRARVIWIKLRLKQQFPQSVNEALNPGGSVIAQSDLPPEPAYGKILNTRKGTTNPLTEQGACLLMALTARGRRGVEQSADFLNASEKLDTDGDGMPEVCDAYGNPLAFFRWPTPPSGDLNFIMITTQAPNGWNPNPPPNASGMPFQDPQDPTGTLQAPAWLASSNGATFQSLCHPVLNQYMVPVIASAGPDGRLGLNLNMSISVTIDAQDNIYSDPTKN